jgi:hypothetical protein
VIYTYKLEDWSRGGSVWCGSSWTFAGLVSTIWHREDNRGAKIDRTVAER